MTGHGLAGVPVLQRRKSTNPKARLNVTSGRVAGSAVHQRMCLEEQLCDVSIEGEGRPHVQRSQASSGE